MVIKQLIILSTVLPAREEEEEGQAGVNKEVAESSEPQPSLDLRYWQYSAQAGYYTTLYTATLLH